MYYPITNVLLQFQPDNENLNTVQTRAEEIPDESLPAYGNLNYTVIPNYSRRDGPPCYHANNGPIFSPPGYNAQGTGVQSLQSREQAQSGSSLPVS
jgi:hypothetical protein